jgi:hypothetical protein
VAVFARTTVSSSVVGDIVLGCLCDGGVLGSSLGSSILTFVLGLSLGDALGGGSLSLVLAGEVFLLGFGLSISIPVVFGPAFFLTSFGVARERRFLLLYILFFPALVGMLLTGSCLRYDMALISVVPFPSLYNAELSSCVFQDLEGILEEQVRLKCASRIVSPNGVPQALPPLPFASITCGWSLRPSEG